MANTMKLINKMQHHAHAFVVHAHLVLEVLDQLGAGEVSFGEGVFLWDQPLLRHPYFQSLRVEFAAH